MYNIYVTDFFNNKIKVITPDGMVSTFAGTGDAGFIDGIPSIATFSNLLSLFIDEDDFIYVTTNNSIRLSGELIKFSNKGLIFKT